MCKILYGALAGLAVCVATPAYPKQYNPVSWHLVDLDWTLPLRQDEAFVSFSLDVDIMNDIVDDTNLYISTINGLIGQHDFYNGIQIVTYGDQPEPTAIPACQKRMGRRRAIFSQWQERRLDAIRTEPPDGTCTSTYDKDDGGNFISVRRPVAWEKGSYTIKLSMVEQDKQGRRWVAMDIIDKKNSSTRRIGALRFPAGHDFRPAIGSFVEVFGGATGTSQIPDATIVFSNMRFNDKPIQPLRASACYPGDVPPFADVENTAPGKLTVKIGRPYDHSALEVKGNCSIAQFEWTPVTP